jgi:hypothetical protein
VKTHLYRHYNAKGELLYVGISLSAVNRLGQHKDHSHWFESITRVDIQQFGNRKYAMDAETLAIRNEKPKHNIKKQRKISDEIEVRNKYEKVYAEHEKRNLTKKIIGFDAVYTLEDVGALLKTGVSSVKLLIQEKKLGSIILPPKRQGLTAYGKPFPPREVVSGWQLIDYFETLHTESRGVQKP